MNYTKKERERYNADRDRACQRLGITKNQYNWFRRKGEELRNIYTDYCNGKITSDYVYQQLAGNLENKINQKAMNCMLKIYFQTDPRGGTIYLDKQPIPENNYTQAVCIY